jgi:hypothetical protein
MSLSTLVHDWQERRRLAAEAVDFPQSELAGLGLNRADFTAIATMSATRVAQMEIMAGLHGVTDAKLDASPETRVQVALTCARCGHTRACAHELTDPEGTTAERCSFCPNADTFEALAKGA